MTFILNHENGNLQRQSPTCHLFQSQNISKFVLSYSLTYRIKKFRERGIFVKNLILKSCRIILKITVDGKTFTSA